MESFIVKLAMRAAVERGPTNSLTVEDALETARARRILKGQSLRVRRDAVDDGRLAAGDLVSRQGATGVPERHLNGM